jgi:uncharacterized membrane protein YeiH
MFLGLVTAVGGGTVRDVVVDVPVFWRADLSYIWVATGASIAAFYGRRFFAGRHVYGLMLYLDALGVALFSIQAEAKVWDLDFAVPAGPVMLGVITAIGGGLIRDILAGRTTLLMRPELYVTPVLLGCIVFALVLRYLPGHRGVGSLACILSIFALRAAAIHWNLVMPSFARLARAGSD